MKIKALLAATLVATSSAAFAGIDNGAEYSTVNGGELILAAWDDVAKKSILFDTGVTFKQLVDNKDANIWTIVDLNTIDSSYKSFFNNDFTNVYWNAYVGSKWSNNEAFDSSKYYGAAYTAVDYVTALNQPRDFGETTAFIEGAGSQVILFNNNFVTPKDTTGVEVNRSYRAENSAAPNYLGNIGSLGWGDTMNGNFTFGTSAKAGEYMHLIWNTANFETAVGSVSDLGRIKFDPSKDQLRINTPLPAAAWLLMSGIAGFGAIARRRKQQA